MRLIEIALKSVEETSCFKSWNIKYRNSLPDSSFAAIEPAYLNNETNDKRCRHLPYKDHNGNIDKSHLQNSLARVNQIKPITDSITAEQLRKNAMEVLEKAKKVVGWD